MRKQRCLLFLQYCSSMADFRKIHAQILVNDLWTDKFLTSELLRICSLSPFNDLNYARKLFDEIPQPSRLVFNHLIRGYSQSNLAYESFHLFVQMRHLGLKPNELTFPFVFKACAALSILQIGIQVHADVFKSGYHDIVYVRNTMIHMYGYCQKIDDARAVFDTMNTRTIVSWNTILSVYIENSCPEVSIQLFSHLRSYKIKPDEATFVVLLSAAAELGSLSFGRWIHSRVLCDKVQINVQLGTALVNMYAKCGALKYARIVFETMPMRNVWTWSAMILGLAQHGSANEALELFSEMKNCSIEPNYVTYLGLLCACSHAGLVDEGRKFFHEMVLLHKIKPTMSHYSTLVDILGRNGRLLEAYNFIKSMPVDPDAVVWRTLLAACQMHSFSHDSDNISEIAKRNLLILEPKRSGNYVIMANMYSDFGVWEEAARIRKVMREEGLKKSAAESFIEVAGSISRFLSGDDSCTDAKIIKRLLKGLNSNMKTSGDTDAKNFFSVE